MLVAAVRTGTTVIVVVARPLDVTPAGVRLAELIVLERDELHAAVRLRGDGWRVAREPGHPVYTGVTFTPNTTVARFLCALAREVGVGVT